jgi:prepilin-type N-terminal cleavage/methylation domain-containing protein
VTASRREGGFTVVEVLVAIIVLSITLMALGPIMAGISRGNRYGQHVTAASARVQEKIEELKSRPYAKVTDGSDTLTSPGMTRTWKVVSEPVAGALKEVDVSVSWKEPGNKTRTVSVKTYIANAAPTTSPPGGDDDDDD